MFLFADLPAAADLPSAIIVTASRASTSQAEAAANVTVIEPERTERLGEPLAVSLLRQVPSAAVSVSGPAGSIAEVRIRGAEANHTLLFIDGIRANDPAAGNIPRFELLNADLLPRIEVVRGPQSALWGSEAIGGVVAVSGGSREGGQALLEGGSNGFGRLAGSFGETLGSVAVGGGAGLQRSKGIDAFAGRDGGDRDGYRNLTGRARISWDVTPNVELGASAFAIAAASEFDGYDPLTFVRADTDDRTRNRLLAGRLWGKAELGTWTITLGGSRLGSRNRNLLGDALVNQTSARRTTGTAQVEREFITGAIHHQLIAAFDHEVERFRSRNPADPFADQEQSRSHQALTGEWKASLGRVATDVAVRRDRFSRFRDATTVRAALLVDAAKGLQLAGSYGEGIAQPTFFDLYGYYPGFFTGNPSLKPERSRGWELSARYARGPWRAALTGYRQRLQDEIVDNADFSSTLNADGASRRRGVEAELGWSPGEWLNLSATYAFLDAEQQLVPSAPGTRELRRPRHSGSVVADGTLGRFSYGGSLTYSGARRDRRDSSPYDVVRLGSYWLAGARVAYRVSPDFELFGRVQNGFDTDYQDVFGYRTEGRSAYAGIRLGLGG